MDRLALLGGGRRVRHAEHRPQEGDDGVIGHGLPVGEGLDRTPAGRAKRLLAFVGKPRLANARLTHQADDLSHPLARPRPARLEQREFLRAPLKGRVLPG